jgi:hypothetical protein
MDEITKQLAQLRPANTNANSAIKKGVTSKVIVTHIFICNTTGSAATYRIFNDINGTTYDQSTALFYDVLIAANSTQMIETRIPIDAPQASGNLAVQSNTSSALTFSIYGLEVR